MISRIVLLAVVLSIASGLSAADETSAEGVQESGCSPDVEERDGTMLNHDYVEVNGVRLHYVSAGEGPTILFLHGFPEFWYMWKNQLEQFGTDHQAVAVDMRGYNLSDKPEAVEEHSIKHLVGDIRGLFDHFSGGNKSVLVAHDWGGAVAWSFAMSHPEYLDKLIIINAPHPMVFMRQLTDNPDQRQASSYMNAFRRDDCEAMLSADNYQLLRAAVFDGSARPKAYTEEDRKAYIEAWSQPGALTGGLNYYRAMAAGPPRNETERETAAEAVEQLSSVRSYDVKVPTLVIWGMKDTALLPGNLDGLDEYVTDLRIERIPDGSHWVISEQPETINTLIRKFLDEE
jgi:pimeloyl-ACP methyl ester carboxylesterase